VFKVGADRWVFDVLLFLSPSRRAGLFRIREFCFDFIIIPKFTSGDEGYCRAANAWCVAGT